MAVEYTIEGGEAGKERLDVLARACAPGTNALLDRIGIGKSARCVDVGCGGGHVTCDMASRVGEGGSVMGIDKDPTVLHLARVEASERRITNVEYRCCDATQLDPSAFDVAYARCLLSHVGNPALVMAAMAAALKPGGVAVLEDVDFNGHFCFPPSRAHDRYVQLYRETVRRRGGNADLGPRLPSLLAEAGFVRIGVAVSHESALQGDAKVISPLTLARIATAVVSEGVASEEDVARCLADLYDYAADPTTVMSMPRIVQAWGFTTPG